MRNGIPGFTEFRKPFRKKGDTYYEQSAIVAAGPVPANGPRAITHVA
jgi:hypothetical protein